MGDTIDLSAIDAIAGTDADDAFHFVAGRSFSGAAGELRFELEDLKGKKNDVTWIIGKVGDDADGDFLVVLSGLHKLKAADFEL